MKKPLQCKSLEANALAFVNKGCFKSNLNATNPHKKH